MNVVVLV
jgi:hypothetical protein